MNALRLLSYRQFLMIKFFGCTAIARQRWGFVLFVLKNVRKPEQCIRPGNNPVWRPIGHWRFGYWRFEFRLQLWLQPLQIFILMVHGVEQHQRQGLGHMKSKQKLHHPGQEQEGRVSLWNTPALRKADNKSRTDTKPRAHAEALAACADLAGRCHRVEPG